MTTNLEKFNAVKALLKKNKDLGIGEACKDAGLNTSAFYFYKNKETGAPAPTKKKYKKKSKPQMISLELAQPNPLSAMQRRVAVIFCDLADVPAVIGGGSK